MHVVAILALHGVVSFDLGIACEVFGRVRTPDAGAAYEVRVCGEAPEVRAGAFSINAPAGLEGLASADTIIIPGTEHPLLPIAAPVLEALLVAWERGARIASICSGAFVLAAAGLLDGRRATTHWLGAADLARLYPAIDVDPDVLFVDEGRIITSAGAAAGLDMCLHLVRRDHGQAAAAHAARLAVAPLHRDGGQAQFIRNAMPGSDASLGPLLEWMGENAHGSLDVQALAARVCVSPRTLTRRFRAQTGTTPLQWLLTARVRRAQELLETTASSVEEIALTVGFDSPVTFRARFQRIAGVSPAAYRRRFSASERPLFLRTKKPHQYCGERESRCASDD
jgi:transcriptional regulator GlxA family with amidase domain